MRINTLAAMSSSGLYAFTVAITHCEIFGTIGRRPSLPRNFRKEDPQSGVELQQLSQAVKDNFLFLANFAAYPEETTT